jgi:hypothetical protein
MRSIFFDLETTDLLYVGQILNYCFIETNEEGKALSELSGKIKINPTQLPTPRAILANKVDVLAHQNTSEDERSSLQRIHSYIWSIVEKHPTVLVGYNSNRFDVPFLRTSMIRNGLNPYFNKNLNYCDVFYMAQKVSLIDRNFYDSLHQHDNMTLESVAKSLGLLEGKQLHESSFDVRLTIKVAQEFKKRYNMNWSDFDCYEPRKSLVLRTRPKFLRVYEREEESHNDTSPMVLLVEKSTQALWIDLLEYQKLIDAGEIPDKRCVFWYNTRTSPFFVDNNVANQLDEWKDIAKNALKDLSDINLDNFFPPKNCDIEQFIYLLDFDGITSLNNSIWNRSRQAMESRADKHEIELYIRHKINEQPDKYLEQLKEYAEYRYGGKLKIDKTDTITEPIDGVFNPAFHPTLGELYRDIDNLLADKTTDKDDRELLNKLKQFYDHSYIMKVAPHLKSIIRQ